MVSKKDNRRIALLISASEYDDSTLQKLISPGMDAQALASVLKDTDIGNFEEVKIIENRPHYEINEEIEAFFSDRRREDLLLLYFSCHGIKDEDGHLYYAAKTTRVKRLASTAISSNFVNNIMTKSRSRCQILVLDCCYSGAFAKGFVTRGDKEIRTKEYFESSGRGRIVLTASDAMQYSFEEDKITREVDRPGSIFTKAIVNGLKTGEADLNEDGVISYNELYEYASNRVTEEMPSQSPRMWVFDVEKDIVIAKNPNPPIPPPLPTIIKGRSKEEERDGASQEKKTSIFWRNLLKLIEEKQLIPFIGHSDSPFLPPQREIAIKWAEQYNYPLEDSSHLAGVAQFLAISNGDDAYPKKLLSTELKEIIPPNFSLEEFRNTQYAVLADLNLPIYITTNYDHFMEEVLKSKGKQPISEFCRWSEELRNYTKAGGISSVFDKGRKYNPTTAEPLVYHLHGDISIPQSMVLTEMDYDIFVSNLSQQMSMLPTVILEALSKGSLLFIGYDLKDVSTQALITHIESSPRYNVMVLHPPTVATNGNTARSQMRYLEKYLRETRKANVYWGFPSSFCCELRQQWENHKYEPRL